MPNAELTKKPAYLWLISQLQKPITDECMLWPFTKRDTYGQIAEHDGHKVKTQHTVHRLVYSLVYGPIPSKMFVCHRCDMKTCFNPKHLFLGTCADNNRDMAKKLRHNHGETHSQARLTDAQVQQIRAEYVPWVVSMSMLSEKYGVSSGHICHIIHRKNRKDV